MKIAPIIEELRKHGEFEALLVHTGQHYDESMSRVFFDELGIPRPDINLEVGSGSHGNQTAKVMIHFEEMLLAEKTPPKLVMVVGDVNSTLACSLVAAKLNIPVAHVEAGLRSYNRSMPEEINRVLTDQLSDFLFTTSRDADENLHREGIQQEKIHFVGNVMIDTLMKNLEKAEESTVLRDLSLIPGEYAALTLHRPSNVDSEDELQKLFGIFLEIQEKIPIVYPAHPRTRKMIEAFGLQPLLEEMTSFRFVDPQGYLDFLKLMKCARFVMTDSGGIQEETTILGVPCLTLRNETERPVTLNQGTNILVQKDRDKILAAVSNILSRKPVLDRRPELWDGRAAERIVRILRNHLLKKET